MITGPLTLLESTQRTLSTWLSGVYCWWAADGVFCSSQPTSLTIQGQQMSEGGSFTYDMFAHIIFCLADRSTVLYHGMNRWTKTFCLGCTWSSNSHFWVIQETPTTSELYNCSERRWSKFPFCVLWGRANPGECLKMYKDALVMCSVWYCWVGKHTVYRNIAIQISLHDMMSMT